MIANAEGKALIDGIEQWIIGILMIEGGKGVHSFLPNRIMLEDGGVYRFEDSRSLFVLRAISECISLKLPVDFVSVVEQLMEGGWGYRHRATFIRFMVNCLDFAAAHRGVTIDQLVDRAAAEIDKRRSIPRPPHIARAASIAGSLDEIFPAI